MSDDSSEEKSLPPSEKKLREARKKGQLAQSKDLVAAVSLTLLFLYLFGASGYIKDRFEEMFRIVESTIRSGSLDWQGAAQGIWSAMSDIVSPMMALSAIGIVLGAIISNKGIIVAFEPLKPDLKRIHPVQGFKKLFSVRNLVEFLKALVKVVILFVALGLTIWYAAPDVMRLPYCGVPCIGPVFRNTVIPMLLIAMLLFIFSSLIDILIQKWLFMRDMRMTHTEMKRERKDTYGDPQVRARRQEIRREGAAESAGPNVGTDPTMVVHAEDGPAIALRYVAGETAAPVVIAKAPASRAAELIELAIATRIPVIIEPEFAENLFRRGRVGAFIPVADFKDAARVLSQTGALG